MDHQHDNQRPETPQVGGKMVARLAFPHRLPFSRFLLFLAPVGTVLDCVLMMSGLFAGVPAGSHRHVRPAL
jgi:hypothetical protein